MSITANTNNVDYILQHRIEWFLRGENAPTTLDETSEDHIEAMIKEGYNQGELCVSVPDSEEEFRGWWSIENK